MNVVAAQVIAIWCAASADVPIQPIKIAAKAKAPTSARYWHPVDNPIRTSELNVERLSKPGQRTERPLPVTRRQKRSVPTIVTIREMSVAQPAPANPSAGAPMLPKMSTQFRKIFKATPRYIISAGTSGLDTASLKFFELMKTSAGTSDQLKMARNGLACARTVSGCRNTESQGCANVRTDASVTPTRADSHMDEHKMTRLCRSIPAPCARETSTPTDVNTPMPKTKATAIREFANAAAASVPVPTCPTINVSTKPINIWPT